MGESRVQLYYWESCDVNGCHIEILPFLDALRHHIGCQDYVTTRWSEYGPIMDIPFADRFPFESYTNMFGV